MRGRGELEVRMMDSPGIWTLFRQRPAPARCTAGAYQISQSCHSREQCDARLFQFVDVRDHSHETPPLRFFKELAEIPQKCIDTVHFIEVFQLRFLSKASDASRKDFGQ